jgi:hypothetical protein
MLQTVILFKSVRCTTKVIYIYDIKQNPVESAETAMDLCQIDTKFSQLAEKPKEKRKKDKGIGGRLKLKR